MISAFGTEHLQAVSNGVLRTPNRMSTLEFLTAFFIIHVQNR
jgi:hypothetical protein